MSWLALAYVMAGGAIGALLRYLISELVARYNTTDFPYATLIVNVTGAFLMGVWIAGASVMAAKGRDPHDLHLLIAVGVLGGFTTFSAFTLDAFILMQRGLALQSALYIAGSLIITMLGLIGGMWAAKYLAG